MSSIVSPTKLIMNPAKALDFLTNQLEEDNIIGWLESIYAPTDPVDKRFLSAVIADIDLKSILEKSGLNFELYTLLSHLDVNIDSDLLAVTTKLLAAIISIQCNSKEQDAVYASINLAHIVLEGISKIESEDNRKNTIRWVIGAINSICSNPNFTSDHCAFFLCALTHSFNWTKYPFVPTVTNSKSADLARVNKAIRGNIDPLWLLKNHSLSLRETQEAEKQGAPDYEGEEQATKEA